MTLRFPRLDILPAAQGRLWPELGPVKNCGFVLYGGTAIALRLGHRASMDFDFFTDRNFQPDKLLEQFAFLARASVLQEAPDTLTALVPVGIGKQEVKLSFFGGLNFGRLADPTLTPDGVLEIASLDDLLAHKLKVILQRVEAKDYLDVDAMLLNGQKLADGLAGAQALYPSRFPAQESLKALTYFEGGDLRLLPGDTKKRLTQAASEVRGIATGRIVSARLSER